jgi:uncharacterized protein YjbK
MIDERERFDKGDWNAICDRCGQKFKASELKRTWDNLYVCHKDFELRHPQDFLRSRRDNQAVAWTRPEGTDRLVTVNPLDPDDVTFGDDA